MPLQLSIDLHAALRKAGGPCDFIQISGGVHGMIYWEKEHPEYKEQVAAWLTKTLAVKGR